MATKVNYLNNRDLLKEIHLSKNSFCVFRDPVNDHHYDVIVESVADIPGSIPTAQQNRADRIKRATGEVIEPSNIPHTDLVFRVIEWEHIPFAPPKAPKAKKKKIAELFDFDEELDDDEDFPPLDDVHIRLNFPPFYHYRLNEANEPFIVGKSHWKGTLENGEFCKTHGSINDNLARMFLKLCERYGTRSNWRNYTYNEEMRGQALLQLAQVGLQFDEYKSQNPFAYYTTAIKNSFTRIVNLEKRNQNIRDDILEINGLNPSWSRQNSGSGETRYEE